MANELILSAERQMYIFDVEPFHIIVCWQQHQRKEGAFPKRRQIIIEGLPKTDWQFKNVSEENNLVSGPQN